MEFLQYRNIKAKLTKRGLLYKKLNPEDASTQFYSLARQLDDHKAYSGLCMLAMSSCQSKNSAQLGAYLNAARTFSKAECEILSYEDQVQIVQWIYKEALLICDTSLLASINLELGRFYESHKLYNQAADCYKQSMSISKCINSLMIAKNYKRALEELKNSPSHLLTKKEHISLFLLELLNCEDEADFKKLSSSLIVPHSKNSYQSSDKDLLPIDDHKFEIQALLESLLFHSRKSESGSSKKEVSKKSCLIKYSIVDKLSAYLDEPQINLLDLISRECLW